MEKLGIDKAQVERMCFVCGPDATPGCVGCVWRTNPIQCSTQCSTVGPTIRPGQTRRQCVPGSSTAAHRVMGKMIVVVKITMVTNNTLSGPAPGAWNQEMVAVRAVSL